MMAGTQWYREALTLTLLALVGTVFWAQTSTPPCGQPDARSTHAVVQRIGTEAPQDVDRTPVVPETASNRQDGTVVQDRQRAVSTTDDDGAFPPQKEFRGWLRATWPQADPSILSGAHKHLAECLKKGLSAEGHSADLKVETKAYMTIAGRPEVKRICEIGFNMGHSAATWLGSNPNAEVIMFDIWQHGCAPGNEAWLRSSAAAATGLHNVSDRLRIIKGSSVETVPKFFAEHPEIKCNVISVDGGHTREIASRDIRNMRMLADPDFHVLLVDDTNFGTDVDLAVEDHLSRGTMRRILGYAEWWVRKRDSYSRGLTVLQYVLNDPHWRTPMTPHLTSLRFNSYDQVDDTGYLQLREHFNGAVTMNPTDLSQRRDLARQRGVQITVARMPGVQKVCIIRNRVSAHLGQDVYPALLWLWANPNVEVLQLMVVDGKTDSEAEEWVRSDAARSAGLVNASARLKVVEQGRTNGPYNSITGGYMSRNSEKCHVIVVEGSPAITTQKLMFLQTLADVNHNVLIVENTNCGSRACASAMAALDGLEALRVVTPPFLSLEDAGGAAGITVVSFI